MCSNYITFRGDDLTKIRKLVNEAEASQTGWLPEEINPDDGMNRYLFDVSIVEDIDDFICIQCETKWAPAIDELEAIGKLCKVSVTNLYEEMGSYEYGRSSFCIETMETTIVYLEEEDFDRVVEGGDDFCTLDGKPICGVFDAYERILEEKIDKQSKYYSINIRRKCFLKKVNQK
jgi:hypothetical protein